MSDKPTWLKIMENGVLGEARARAFLCDRFWVLDRSVDIQGADYLIQQRLTNKNFLEEIPPRLGVVQVKYIQDGKTPISIKSEYVEDYKGIPYSEFFLLIFSGLEDNEVSFLFSGNDIVNEFERKEKYGKSCYEFKGSNILSSNNYKIVSKKIALDKIEHALKNSNFYRNRQFLNASSYIKIEDEHIDYDLLLPSLDNNGYDIREIFFEYKNKVQDILFDMEEVIDAINKILRTTNPVDAFDIYSKKIKKYIGYDNYISFNAKCFEDDDLEFTAQNHKERLEKIRKLNIESNYFGLIKKFDNEFIAYIKNKDITNKKAIRIIITYNQDLSSPFIRFEETSIEQKKYPIFEESNLGSQKFIDYLRRELPNKEKIEMEELLIFRKCFLWQLDTLLFGEEFVGRWWVYH